MRVCLDLQPCTGRRSGVGIYTYELAKRLRSADGLEFEGNLFNFLYRNDNRAALAGIGMPVRCNRWIPYGVYRRIWHFLPLPYRCMFRGEADVTHFFNFIVPPGVKGKVITTIHDLAFHLYPETLDPRNLKRIQKDIRYSVDRSDRIVAVSTSTKRGLMEAFHLPEDRIEIIYPSFSSPATASPESEMLWRLRIGSPYLLYVGNLEPRKNIDRLVLAYAKLKRETGIPHQLVLAGQKGWLYDDIFRTVSSEGLENDVVFTGYITEADKAALYQYASLFVYPSLYEGFGIPILEAMAVGVPVVCSNTSSMPEAAGNAALLINPRDTDAIAQAMYRLLTDETLRTSKTALGKVQARKFSWEKSADDLRNLYRSMAE